MRSATVQMLCSTPAACAGLVPEGKVSSFLLMSPEMGTGYRQREHCVGGRSALGKARESTPQDTAKIGS